MKKELQDQLLQGLHLGKQTLSVEDAGVGTEVDVDAICCVVRGYVVLGFAEQNTKEDGEQCLKGVHIPC